MHALHINLIASHSKFINLKIEVGIDKRNDGITVRQSLTDTS